MWYAIEERDGSSFANTCSSMLAGRDLGEIVQSRFAVFSGGYGQFNAAFERCRELNLADRAGEQSLIFNNIHYSV